MLVCAAVVSALEGKDCREVMKSIAEISPVPADRLQHIVAGMHRLLSEALRIPPASLKQEVSISVMTQKVLFTFHISIKNNNSNKKQNYSSPASGI